MSDRVAVMNAGVLEQVGAPEDVYHRPQTAFVADFVGASNRLAARIVGAAGDGHYRAAIDGMGERSVSGAQNLNPGTPVVVVIRPEELDLVTPSDGPGVIVATVVDVAFLGAQRTVRLESPAVGPLVASTGGGTPAPVRGAQVGVTFRDEHSWAVPVPTGGE